MLKAIGTTGDNERVIYFGLTRDLMRSLHEGQAIRINGDALGIPAEIVVFAGSIEAVADDNVRVLTVVENTDTEISQPTLANRAND